ncbi:SWI/SNF chromatin-remodeling complex subunit SNF5 [Sporobolomyces koalae]|uniref:SWI/SNF chromatin-remodeling complex subunit SNF5 n=1 Tax=Sporobolomyces koalae TaxID=500713 RepID=UPI0031808595
MFNRFSPPTATPPQGLLGLAPGGPQLAMPLEQRSGRSVQSMPSHATSAPATILLPQEDDAPPHKIPVDAKYARVAATEPGDPFPSISPQDQARVKAWIDRDVQFEQDVIASRKRNQAEIMALADEIVNGQDFLGLPAPPSQFKIRWDDEKDREQAAKRRGPLRKPIRLSKRQMRSAASRAETLVPVRIDVEHEAWKLRDTFTWNLLETDITPEVFASHLCADLRLPERPFVQEIVTSIKKALEDAQASSTYEAYLGDGGSSLAEENRKWFAEWSRQQSPNPVVDDLNQVVEIGQETNIIAHEELRITIKLDVTLDGTQLVDKLEWDISNPRNSPEEFAETYTIELGLTGEFKTAVAHSIREQIDNYVKSLSLLSHAAGGIISDDDLRRDFLPYVQDAFRSDQADLYSPNLTQLSVEDLDRNDKERERDVRRKRRQTKGRGVTLPDRESVKTHRTLVPRPLPGLMQTQVNGGDVIYPLPELAHPYPIVTKPGPPKPEGMETSESSPLRLVTHDREAPAGPPQALRGAALANANAKRARLEGTEIPAIAARPQDFGLQPHIFDGKWFCANCGIPDTIAIGRRKGPTGEHNLCGECGKFYQRYRKNRVCQYTRDLETHRRLQRPPAEAKAKTGKRLRRGNTSATTTPMEGTPALAESDTPTRSNPQSLPSRVESPASLAPPDETRRTDVVDDDDDDEQDEEEEESDDSQPVRAPRKRRRANHYGSPDTPFVQDDSNSDSDSNEDEDEDDAPSPPAPPPPPPRAPNPLRAPEPSAPPAVPMPAANQTAQTASRATIAPPEPFPWMVTAAADLRARQIDDRFELIPRAKPGDPSSFEWRIRCLDCPGKLYNLGPGETFDGFLIHFKNRNHRANVEARLASQQQISQ